MTAACEISSQYCKMITKFSVLNIKSHLPIFATTRRYFCSSEKAIFHRKAVVGRLTVKANPIYSNQVTQDMRKTKKTYVN